MADTAGQSLLELRNELPEVAETDERLVSELLVHQIESANVIVINKCDSIAGSERMASGTL